mmetsp:Transcript_18571/g.35391  ORF Transcript_18571/g.35391 Transcript_18571/m.35391 type:complete len:146 (-) Transcript_18571:125-562(-)
MNSEFSSLETSTKLALLSRRRPKVILGVSGSVATIKLGLLASSLRDFADVKIVSTQASMHFIRSLPQHVQEELGEIAGDDDEWHRWKTVGDPVMHIDLRRWADILVIAPLSANTLAKVQRMLVTHPNDRAKKYGHFLNPCPAFKP